MCTCPITIDDELMNQLRPTFPTMESVSNYLQEKAKQWLLQIVSAQKEKTTEIVHGWADEFCGAWQDDISEEEQIAQIYENRQNFRQVVEL